MTFQIWSLLQMRDRRLTQMKWITLPVAAWNLKYAPGAECDPLSALWYWQKTGNHMEIWCYWLRSSTWRLKLDVSALNLGLCYAYPSPVQEALDLQVVTVHRNYRALLLGQRLNIGLCWGSCWLGLGLGLGLAYGSWLTGPRGALTWRFRPFTKQRRQ